MHIRIRLKRESVTKLSRSNIYEAGAVGIAELYADYLERYAGSDQCIALSISSHPLDAAAHDAVSKSLAALGYGNEACTYATTVPQDSTVEGGEIVLDPQALFMLVEGIDPLLVIVADDQTTRLLGEAYRCSFAPDSAVRVFGRPGIAFSNLETMLGTNEGKQRAWHLFKTLPKRA